MEPDLRIMSGKRCWLFLDLDVDAASIYHNHQLIYSVSQSQVPVSTCIATGQADRQWMYQESSVEESVQLHCFQEERELKLMFEWTGGQFAKSQCIMR